MKEMTARELLDAIRSGLEETSRRLGKKYAEQTQPEKAPMESSAIDEGSTQVRERAGG
jgi:hypothetical protein